MKMTFSSKQTKNIFFRCIVIEHFGLHQRKYVLLRMKSSNYMLYRNQYIPAFANKQYSRNEGYFPFLPTSKKLLQMPTDQQRTMMNLFYLIRHDYDYYRKFVLNTCQLIYIITLLAYHYIDIECSFCMCIPKFFLFV